MSLAPESVTLFPLLFFQFIYALSYSFYFLFIHCLFAPKGMVHTIEWTIFFFSTFYQYFSAFFLSIFFSSFYCLQMGVKTGQICSGQPFGPS